MIHKRKLLARLGFTLIELLVVIAIIAILIGLLLPAVQKVRDAMYRAECQNNLRQIGIALHSYQDINRVFPPGFSNTPGNNNRGWGWGTFILPFVEQNNLFTEIEPHNNFHPGSLPANPNPPHILQTRLPVYLCPANQPNNPNSSRGNQGTSSYVGFFGNHSPLPSQTTKGNGVFFPRSRVPMGDIPDGTSNTAFIGERSLGKVGATTYSGAVWPGNHGGWASTIRHIDPNSGTVDIFFGTSSFAFSSHHASGLNVLLGDGAVRFLSDSTPPQVQAFLAQRNDGQVFQMP